MNRSRSNTPRHGERPSLDALNRTIEGLEARIEGLMEAAGRPARTEAQAASAPSSQLSEIFDRQKMLDQNRQQQAAARPRSRSLADEVREIMSASATARQNHAHPAADRPVHAPEPQKQNAFDIAAALVSLRGDLKRDISESFAREISELRREVRDVGLMASDANFAAEIHADMQRLNGSIERLGQVAGNPAARDLQDEFDSLRSMLGGLARRDDVYRLADSIPTQAADDDAAVREGLLELADRIDGIKAQLKNAVSDTAGRATEAKLGKIAEAMEILAKQMPHHGVATGQDLAVLEQRLEDIHATLDLHAQAQDAGFTAGSAGLNALEDRIAHLTDQLDAVAPQHLHDDIVGRIDGLMERIEDLGYDQATARLEQRLDELSGMLDQVRHPTELTGFLSDISRKIDALDYAAINDDLASRFDRLARRIDELETSPQPAAGHEESFLRLEEHLKEISARLDGAAAPGEVRSDSLHSLETQIANLTELLSQPQTGSMADLSGIANRMSAIEDYMATNDEYIVEAARQAAETALEAYVRNFGGHTASASVPPADLTMISELAADLHALEELTRSGDERSQRTFEALQQTLVQIAERVDQLGQAAEPAAARVAERVPSVGRNHLRTGTDAVMYSDDFDDDFDLDTVESVDSGKPAKGILASIGKRLRPNGHDTTAQEPRRTLNTAPTLDAADDISPDIANQLLEPGSGAPDIRQILEKVRAVQEGKSAKAEPAAARDDEESDYIAVARRAAQAAAAETAPVSRIADAPKAAPSLIGKYRRLLLLGTGAVLLAVMSWPLVSTMFVEPSAPVQSQAPAASKPAAAVAKVEKQAVEPAQKAGADATAKQDAAPSSVTDAAPAKPADAGALPEKSGEDTSAAADPAANAKPETAQTAPDAVEIKPLTAEAGASSTKPSPVGSTVELTAPSGIEPQALVDAAKANDPLAVFEIGNRIFEGRGVTADPAAALAWYSKAAALGFAPAEYRLGSMYEKGTGVSVDPAKAMDHYIAAANAGNISAMHNLAVLYATGTIGAPDFTSAAKWFTDAANHGVRDSQFNLAILYAKGSGVEQNLEQSYKWFGIAAKDGDADAAKKRDEVGKVLTGDQVTKAKAEIDAWKVAPTDDKANATVIPDAWAGKPQKTSSIDMKKAITYIQAMLNKNGFDVGRPDGLMGAKTVAAIKQFQSSVGQQPTGEINDALVKELIARNK